MGNPIEVVAAVILHEGSFLCVKKGAHRFPYLQYKYEFPGGKTEADESAAEALVREIREELRMEIKPIRPILSVQHAYPDFEILLHAWLCSCAGRDLLLLEHSEHRWLTAEELHKLDWAAADWPVVRFLQDSPLG